MKNLTYIFIAFIWMVVSCSTQKKEIEKTQLEIKGNSFYINGKKTFINALGYEIGARPGQDPYKDKKVPELKRMEYDLAQIKDAGFVAIRTWSELTEPELRVAQKSGLKIIFGIWINPHGEFGDLSFVRKAKEQVMNTMAYSKKYDCIITYLIMNEPMVAHIHQVGAEPTVELWKTLRDIIHEEHPGIPVTISNSSAISDFIDQNIFDVYGFNAYNHGKGLVYTQSFPEHFNFLRSINGNEKPLLVTEFGMSVSQNGYGTYGGNTLKKQAEHVIENFSDILDGGAAGACAFYYADGWWKAQDPFIHNPEPEEWFGFWGYSGIRDTIGYPRPVWYAIKNYNQAIITSPRNHRIYGNKVPFEVFFKEQIKKMRIVYVDKVIYDNTDLPDQYISDTLTFGENEIKDRELLFEFYNKNKELIKYETILFLTSEKPVILPEIKISVKETDLALSKNCDATFNIENQSPFIPDNEIKYVFGHHIGWDSGVEGTWKIAPEQTNYSFNYQYKIPAECQVLTISAGMDIRFGKFIKRIHAEKILYRDNWAKTMEVK